jgi:hypothetical protein
MLTKKHTYTFTQGFVRNMPQKLVVRTFPLVYFIYCIGRLRCTCCDQLNMQVQVLGLPVFRRVRRLNSKVDWDPEAEVYMLSSLCSALSFFCKSTGTPFSRTNDNSHLCNTRTVMDTHLWAFKFVQESVREGDTLASSSHLDDLESGGEGDWRAFFICKSCCSRPLPLLTFASDVSTITFPTGRASRRQPCGNYKNCSIVSSSTPTFAPIYSALRFVDPSENWPKLALQFLHWSFYHRVLKPFTLCTGHNKSSKIWIGSVVGVPKFISDALTQEMKY